jgi:hypothetical protein
VERLDATAVRAVRLALDAQPLTEAKVAFAWSLAAGPALARSASVTWHGGTLSVRARSEAWRQEINRARPVIQARMAQLLGPDVVKHLRVLEGDSHRA